MINCLQHKKSHFFLNLLGIAQKIKHKGGMCLYMYIQVSYHIQALS